MDSNLIDKYGICTERGMRGSIFEGTLQSATKAHEAQLQVVLNIAVMPHKGCFQQEVDRNSR